MGAQIKGAGTTTIKITGVDTLHGTEYQVIPDRIEGIIHVYGGCCWRRSRN